MLLWLESNLKLSSNFTEPASGIMRFSSLIDGQASLGLRGDTHCSDQTLYSTFVTTSDATIGPIVRAKQQILILLASEETADVWFLCKYPTRPPLFREYVSKLNIKSLLKLFPAHASRHFLYCLFLELSIGKNSLR